MKKQTIITHDGSYHADDVFAVAALSLFLLPAQVEIVRTRDEEIIKGGDFVVDVGGIYDEAKRRFDHHQRKGTGERLSGIPFASFGLVWKFCGEKLCGTKSIASAIDTKLIAPIDANDNGVEIAEYKFPDVSTYSIQNFFRAHEPTWKESTNYDAIFLELVEIAKKIIEREIKIASDEVEARSFVERAYKESADKRLLILEKRWPWKKFAGDQKELLFVVYPDSRGNWGAQAVTENINSFKNKKDFPLAWGGKRNEEFAEITGVSDALFCHRALFAAYARSKEGAIALAKFAIGE